MLWEFFLIKILEICLSQLGGKEGRMTVHQGATGTIGELSNFETVAWMLSRFDSANTNVRTASIAWKSKIECKYVFLILQVLIKETAPLKKDVNLSNDLHYHIIIQLSVGSGLKQASRFPYSHVLSLKSPTFSSSTTELIVSQWGWNEIHIFLFRWHNPLWPSMISQESVSSGWNNIYFISAYFVCLTEGMPRIFFP